MARRGSPSGTGGRKLRGIVIGMRGASRPALNKCCTGETRGAAAVARKPRIKYRRHCPSRRRRRLLALLAHLIHVKEVYRNHLHHGGGGGMSSLRGWLAA